MSAPADLSDSERDHPASIPFGSSRYRNPGNKEPFGNVEASFTLAGDRESSSESSVEPAHVQASRMLTPVAEPRPVHPLDFDVLRERGYITPDGSHSHLAEEIRRIKRLIVGDSTRNDSTAVSTTSNVIVVTSALPGEGKTFCAMNLAMSVAMELDRTALLVDCDFVKQTIARHLNLDDKEGLLDVLAHRGVELHDVLRRTSLERLCVLTPGHALINASELFASDMMYRLVREMALRYGDRIIIIDTPPLLTSSAASVLASLAGKVLMVVEAGKTLKADFSAALAQLDCCPAVRVVFNKSRSRTGLRHYEEYRLAHAAQQKPE